MLVILFSVALAAYPSDWIAREKAGNMLLTTTEPSSEEPSDQVTIGNGYIGSIIGADYIYVNGLYNGYLDLTPSHGAKLPNPMNIKLELLVAEASAIDLEYGLFYRRHSYLGCVVEETIYAHREYEQLYAYDLTLTGGSQDVTFNIKQNLNPRGSTDVEIIEEKYVQNQGIWIGKTRVPETLSRPTTQFTISFDILPTELLCEKMTTYTASYYMHVSYGETKPFKPSLTDSYLDLHKQAWEAMWISGIEIQNYLSLGQVVNSTIYYLYSSLRSDYNFAPTTNGIASNSYNKHVHWDSEVYMLPSLMLLRPDLAKAALQYRLDVLPGSFKKSASYNLGYRGCMISWGSASTGEEACITTEVEARLGHHISSDTVLGIRNYYYMTGDLAFLKSAWDLIKGVADFWISRVTPLPTTQPPLPEEYHIKGVIPPDRNAINVDDSVYTNAGAQRALFFAYEAAEALGKTPDPYWAEVGEKLVILFDDTAKMHPEYSGYSGEQVNQADVIMLNYPLEYYEQTKEVIKNDLDYYSQVTTEDGPCLTWSMFCIGYLSIGMSEMANDYFLKSYKGFVQQPWNVWTEKSDGTGARNFLAGAGGFLQAILNGYGGIRIERNRLVMNPQLIPLSDGWKMRSLNYKGKNFDVTVAADGSVQFKCISGDIVVCQESCQPLTSGETIDVNGEFSVNVFS